MPAKKKAAAPAPAKSLEVQLWDAADKMRGAVPPTDYMHVCLGLVFLRYLSAAFERKHAELLETPHADAEDHEEYQADNVFWVPVEARWGTLQGFARASDVGKRLDDAMRAIERENDDLKGVLPKIFGKADFSPQMLGGLIDHFTNLNLTGMSEDFDFLGRVYEFFLGEFSAMQGKAGGEQYTPRCMVTLMVDMIEPYRGRIYDCCHGTGGFYVQSNRFVLAHAGRLDDIAVFGQERNPETYRLARMNLAIRGITGDLRWNNEGTLLKDAFPDMRFDFNLANPPFNIKDWTLFKSWFVDFDPVRAKLEGRPPAGMDAAIAALFPDHFQDSELGQIPKGWEVVTLGSVLDTLETGRRPKGGVAGYSSGVPSVGAESINGIGVFDFSKTKYIPHEFYEKTTSGRIQNLDVLLYKDGGKPGEFRPRVGLYGYGFPFDEFCINEHVFRMRADSVGQHFLYFTISDERVLLDFANKGGKAAIPGINQTDVRSTLILLPPKSVLAEFEKQAQPICQSIIENFAESRDLATLRDTLLPKLLSGEVSAPAAEALIAASR